MRNAGSGPLPEPGNPVSKGLSASILTSSEAVTLGARDAPRGEDLEGLGVEAT